MAGGVGCKGWVGCWTECKKHCDSEVRFVVADELLSLVESQVERERSPPPHSRRIGTARPTSSTNAALSLESPISSHSLIQQ